MKEKLDSERLNYLMYVLCLEDRLCLCPCLCLYLYLYLYLCLALAPWTHALTATATDGAIS